MLIAVPLVITMAVGLVLGLHLVSQGNASLKLSAQGTGAATATPAATGDGAAPRPARRPRPVRRRRPRRPPAAAAAATPNPNCTLIVPANPLTAEGLATPYQLVARRGDGASGCTRPTPTSPPSCRARSSPPTGS